MFQLCNQLGFTLKTSKEVGVFEKCGVQDFERYIAIKLGVMRLVDRCHTTAPKLLDDAISTYIFAYVESHSSILCRGAETQTCPRL